VEQPVDHAPAEARVDDAGDVPPGEVGEAVDEEPEQKDQRTAPDDLGANGPIVVAAGAPRAEREVRRDADDEQKEREDEVGRRPAMPGGMLERRVYRFPGPRIVHEEHAGDGEPPEHVQRQQPLARRDGWRVRERGAQIARAW
jgi:hypothetical protein